MGLYDESLFNVVLPFMTDFYNKNPEYNGTISPEQILSLYSGKEYDQEPFETSITEQQMTAAIRKQNPDYNPDPDKMAYNAAMIPQVKNAIAKGLAEGCSPFMAKVLSNPEILPSRGGKSMIMYAHKFCQSEIGQEEKRAMPLIDEHNAMRADIKTLKAIKQAARNKERFPGDGTLRAYNDAMIAKPGDSEIVKQAKGLSGEELIRFIEDQEALQNKRFNEIRHIKDLMINAAADHMVHHIKDKDPVTGITLAETVTNHMNTQEDIVKNYPDSYLRMKAYQECEDLVKHGTISEEKYGVEEYRGFLKELDKVMPATINVSATITAYTSALCGIIDVDQIKKGGLIEPDKIDVEGIAEHPAMTQIGNIGALYTGSFARYFHGVTGSDSVTFISEDGNVIQEGDMSAKESTRMMLQQGKLMFAVANNKPGQKPTPFMFDKQGKIYVGDEIAKHAAEMKEPKIDPSVKKPGAFSRFLGGISNSLKSDAVKKWDKAVADYDAAMKEYRNFKAMAAKTTPEKLDAARNKVDAANAKKAGKSVKEYQKEMAAKEKADRESYNSKLFEEANAEVTAEKEAKAEAKRIMVDQIKMENAKEYNKEKLLDAFEKHCPQGIPDQLRANIEKISDAALESQNKLTEVVNYNTSIKGADVKNELKGIAAYNEMLMAAGSDKLSPERLEIYSHPDYPAIANNMLDKNVAIEYAAGTTFKSESFKTMVMNGELMKNFGDYFSKQVQESIEASKQMTADKANGIQEQPKVQEEKPAKAPSAMGLH